MLEFTLALEFTFSSQQTNLSSSQIIQWILAEEHGNKEKK